MFVIQAIVWNTKSSKEQNQRSLYIYIYVYVCVCIYIYILVYILSQNKHIYPAKIFVLLIKEK